MSDKIKEEGMMAVTKALVKAGKGGGDSQRPPVVPPAQQRPRELHPAAADTIERIHQVWDENERLVAENRTLSGDNEVLRRVDAEKSALISTLRQNLEDAQKTADDRVYKTEAHLRERLAEAERNKERYLRYAVTISERLKACGDQIAAAHDVAMDMASKVPDQQLDEVEAAVKAAAAAAGGEAK
jgi:hypothetical protein